MTHEHSTNFNPQGGGAEHYENFGVQVATTDQKGVADVNEQVFKLKFYTEADGCDLEFDSK